MSKGTNLISEIGKYFKENDATRCHQCNEQNYGDNTYVELLGEKALWRGKQMQLQVLAVAGAVDIVVVSLFHDQECV